VESGPFGIPRRLGLVLPAVLALVLAGCGGDLADDRDSDGAIPGLAEANEVPVVETEPDASEGSCTWSNAYMFDGLPQINVGQPSAGFMEDAARDPAAAGELVCFGDGSGSGGAAELDSPEPQISGVSFGGPDVRAWAWSNVPDQAVAVQFTDQDGTTSWQRTVEGLVRLVVFPDTIVDDPDGVCPCRFDAIDSDGVVIASVDIRTGTYIDG
jgi:hypothetical protein